jgi:hypothetical protein
MLLYWLCPLGAVLDISFIFTTIPSLSNHAQDVKTKLHSVLRRRFILTLESIYMNIVNQEGNQKYEDVIKYPHMVSEICNTLKLLLVTISYRSLRCSQL